MPRISDFDKFGEEDDSSLKEPREGVREQKEEQYFSHPFNWSDPQFEYNPKIEDYYKNETVDLVFNWIEENLKDEWHWHETWCNNGRSLTIFVWFKSEEDIMAFEKKWVDSHFKISYGHPAKKA